MRTGNQNPTFSVIGDYSHSNAKDVVEVFRDEGGASFYPCQEYELELMLAVNEDGSPAATTIGIAKPRQNGKSYSARNYASYKADFENKRVLFSAHHSSTTHKMFKELLNLFDNKERFPEFASDVKDITRGRGFEGIYFKDWIDSNGVFCDGGCIEFQTRTNSGARGGTYDIIIIDEAQELTEDQLASMLPTISAASDVNDTASMPQIIYLGTPPDETCNGTVFVGLHKKMHGPNPPKDIWWLEWAVNKLSEITEESVIDIAYRTNPAMGYRITEKVVLNEYHTMALDKFARERLGWWSEDIQKIDYAINHTKWKNCMSEEMKPEGRTAYGIKFSADGSEVALSGAVIDENDVVRISLIRKETTSIGIRWLADWLNERYRKASCVVIDGRNNTDLLIDRISEVWKVKGSIVKASTNDVIASASLLIDSINDEKLTWYKYQDELNDSALNCTKRKISGGFGFGGTNSCCIESCALALYGVRTSKRDPNKKMRIG